MVRRNTGYALDVLAREYKPFNPQGKSFSLVPLLCGSEGTLAITTSAALKLVPLVQSKSVFVLFYDDVLSALEDVQSLVDLAPAAIELIDKETLD